MKTIFSYILLFFVYGAFAQEMDIFDVARKGSVEQFQKEYKKDSSILNKKNDQGYTPLILACYSNNKPLVIYLIENKADLNAGSGMGTALMAAVVKGQGQIVKLLLDAGADPDLTDKNNTTALIYAVMFQNEEIVKLLVNAKADIYIVDNKGKSALDYAKMFKNETLITTLKSI